MHLHIITIIFIILEHITKILTQGVPISPCPKMFQYRFDGTEWFGVVSVRNPDIGQALHLRLMLSMRGKPNTNYLGEIELLTRGQFASDAPVLYKIKFPKSNFPPKLLQITTNNHVVCLGAADHSIFVTQIQLEHTRKFTFISEDGMAPISMASDFSMTPSAAASSAPSPEASVDNSFLPINAEFGAKHLSFPNRHKNSMWSLKEVCGKIDDRIRFQIMHAVKMGGKGGLAASMILSRTDGVDDNDSGGGDAAAIDDDVDYNSMPLITTDLDGDISSAADDNADDLMHTDELPTITRGAWPWLAAIYVNNLTSLAYQCGGTLVSARIVITSAHCFQLFKKTYTSNEVLVFLGRHNLHNWNEEGSVAAPVDDIFIHPDFDKHLNSYDADIAVVMLKHEVRFNTFIRPACMWSGSTKVDYLEGEHGIVVGWNLGSNNNIKSTSTHTTKAIPKLLHVPIASNEMCFKANSQFRSLSSNRTFCAGLVTETATTRTPQTHRMSPAMRAKFSSSTSRSKLTHGPCTGDSGAGLMLFRNNHWILRGTISASLPLNSKLKHTNKNNKTTTTTNKSNTSCTINQYVIYTDVAKFLDWVFAFII